MKRHINKGPAAAAAADDAALLLTEAMAILGRAESKMELSGWGGAAHGIHQAKLRVDSWRDKIYAELAAIGRGDLL